MSKMDITANTRSFILPEQFEYINSKNYQLQDYIFSAIGKASLWKKTSLAVWDNEFLIRQITIHTKSLVGKDKVYDK